MGEDQQNVSTKLEGIVKAWIEAANNRDFSDDSVLWKHKAPFFEAEIAMSHQRYSLQEHFDKSKEIAEANPEYVIKVLSMTTDVDQKGLSAQVYTNSELHGLPPGVVRGSVTITVFRLMDGEWSAVKLKSLAGMDSSSG